ncbi:hypothetical protein FN846DRAFT_914549 [Sphaerosporella brunnea]|uniref:Uncharacterized protein n=1 Tax=Sphaerosporella brunnea TaxID=1250544 RepID=A0A5J5EE63_9PEZI|nr:hypothetical protein FN846DRAFT_914549 [Sphaerosporella brunnea]
MSSTTDETFLVFPLRQPPSLLYTTSSCPPSPSLRGTASSRPRLLTTKASLGALHRTLPTQARFEQDNIQTLYDLQRLLHANQVVLDHDQRNIRTWQELIHDEHRQFLERQDAVAVVQDGRNKVYRAESKKLNAKLDALTRQS